MSRLLEILASKYPIIQGPIGELNDPKMVAAVYRGKPVNDIIEGLVS